MLTHEGLFDKRLRTSSCIKTTQAKTGGGCQDCNNLSSLDPSLWNSPIGRRRFLKKSGKASVATALALNGLMFEVLASESPSPSDVIKTITFVFRWDRSFNLVGSASTSRFAAIQSLISLIQAEAWVPSELENPHMTWISGPRECVGSSVAVYHGGNGSSGGQLFDGAIVATNSEGGYYGSTLQIPISPELPTDEELISIVWTFHYAGE